jgi:hypothetical protein
MIGVGLQIRHANVSVEQILHDFGDCAGVTAAVAVGVFATKLIEGKANDGRILLAVSSQLVHLFIS